MRDSSMAPGTELVISDVIPSDQPVSPEELQYLDRALILMGLLLAKRLLRWCDWPDDVKVGVLDHLNLLIPDLKHRVILNRYEGSEDSDG